eukprot:TRINITY_DN58587_c0_g1_i1.p1 TRINITY_DN58587_c0_g1~~TRINITY_DN58587_c0_g1_i1.p1  ORF type:complete len:607 (+),score=88.77 TRINITY_DN58587_c0_g1_i1:101-1921(+)
MPAMVDVGPGPSHFLSATLQRQPEIDLQAGNPADVFIHSAGAASIGDEVLASKPLDMDRDCHPAMAESRGLSAQFKRLVDQVICGHLQEVQDLQAEVLRLQENNMSLQVHRKGAATSHVFVDGYSEHRNSHGAVSEPLSLFSGKGPMRQRLNTERVMHALDAWDSESQLVEHLAEPETRDGSAVEAQDQQAHAIAATSRYNRLSKFLESNSFEMLISGLLLMNVVFMALELQFTGLKVGATLGYYDQGLVDDSLDGSASLLFSVVDKVFTGLFFFDVSIRICVLRGKFCRLIMNWVDVVVVAASMVELFAAALPFSPVMFRLLRVGKLARALRMVTTSNALQSLQLLIKCIQASVDMLFWSFLLLTFIQCVAGMIVSYLVQSFIEDPDADLKLRIEVFMYYGTFSRTFLSMFEILFANWSPPCRILTENVSETFSLFFLIYRCVLGFAVINVVNAVFVQQTMKTASSDEELAYRQKQKEIAMYTRKVKQLFQSIDASGDGTLSFDEFAKLVESPKLSFWLSQLQLEYHDLLSLFEFMDNGDREITLNEFIDGAARLKGTAKAIDVFRLETKLELMLAELLRAQGGKGIEEVFRASRWSHMQPTILT